MNKDAKKMLEALRKSANENTRTHAIDILEGRRIAWAPKDISAEKLATTGSLGGFLQSVMTGDYREAWQHADELNREAIAGIVPADAKRGYTNE